MSEKNSSVLMVAFETHSFDPKKPNDRMVSLSIWGGGAFKEAVKKLLEPYPWIKPEPASFGQTGVFADKQFSRHVARQLFQHTGKERTDFSVFVDVQTFADALMFHIEAHPKRTNTDTISPNDILDDVESSISNVFGCRPLLSRIHLKDAIWNAKELYETHAPLVEASILLGKSAEQTLRKPKSTA